MRQKRAKTYKKLMALYHMSFGFREPYQVLVDSAMCTTSITLKLDLIKQFSSVLQGNVKPMITQCSMVELYKLGRGHQPAVDLAKNFERRKCNHREAIPGDECIASVVGETNKHRYVIASDSQEMRARLRMIPGVPVVHLNRTVMVLEPASEATLEAKRKAEEKSLLPPSDARPAPGDVSGTELKRKRKGPKGPNPLSVKKKKVKTEEVGETRSGEKRKAEDNNDAPSGEVQDSSNKPKRKRRKKGHIADSTDPG